MDRMLVIMPVYNTGKYLQGAIESVLQQKNVDLDLCIVNDASTDDSSEIISHYSDRDNVIVFENKTNRGTYFSRNRGLDLLNSNEYSYFTVHDSDDMSDINRYHEMIQMFIANPNMICIWPHYIRIDERYMQNGIDVSKGIPNRDGGGGIAVYRSIVFDKIGYYDNSRFGADTDYFFRVREFCRLNKQYVVGEFNKIMYYARRRPDNLQSVVVDRHDYIQKIYSDLRNMRNNNNFFRDKFL